MERIRELAQPTLPKKWVRRNPCGWTNSSTAEVDENTTWKKRNCGWDGLYSGRNLSLILKCKWNDTEIQHKWGFDESFVPPWERSDDLSDSLSFLILPITTVGSVLSVLPRQRFLQKRIWYKLITLIIIYIIRVILCPPCLLCIHSFIRLQELIVC